MDAIIRPRMTFLPSRRQLIPLVAREWGGGARETRGEAPGLPTRGAPFPWAGTRALGDRRSPGPVPGPSAAPPHSERARCTGVARAPGTVSISAGPTSLPRPPSGRPPRLPACTARPPPWAREPSSSRAATGRARGLCLRLGGPGR